MYLKFFSVVAVLFLLLAAGCGQKEEKKKEVMVNIRGSDIITVEEFEEQYSAVNRESARYPVKREMARKLKADFLNQMIEEQLIIMEGARLGLGVDRGALDAAIAEVKKDYFDEKSFKDMLVREYINFEKWREQVRKKLLIEKVLYLSVSSQVKITPPDIEKHYNKHIEEFKGEEQVRARQILLSDEAAAAEARKRIEGGETFAAVAREVSLSPDAGDGGDLGYFARGVMPSEFDDVVFTIEQGVLSDVISSPYGYHLFLVDERKEARDYTLEEVRDEVSEILRRDREEHLYKNWMEGLKEKMKIDINEEALKRSISTK